MQGRGKKTSYDKNARAAEEFQKGKKLGRPKQMWVEATVNGKPLPTTSSFEEIAALIHEDTIGNYIPAHWEKVK